MYDILVEFWTEFLFSLPMAWHITFMYLGYPKIFPFCGYQLDGGLSLFFTFTLQNMVVPFWLFKKANRSEFDLQNTGESVRTIKVRTAMHRCKELLPCNWTFFKGIWIFIPKLFIISRLTPFMFFLEWPNLKLVTSEFFLRFSDQTEQTNVIFRSFH